ncbi:TonB-dependent receptor [Vibrio europaeus]|uniref:TonB-dependent receptor n=1 Tax=Vibrio europaeus TaxID=300876 RepID=A0A178J4K1_9VIBR|nr:TonB-dependent receptor [Vibrio europaeus]MDC5706240.1 TonB-dependent receptor [Vibrio europaeus]MDC5709650.1 TonB-dependent receptor [Vibrio europaeus]MDC5714049.1 TonB-dependent receptor [Vibrio europaeus]MDC5720788.1 TonB-dependent receptor [Vibrio europaeus]MDC5723342.1 TonB-dependent receptor [Vibrio europaeus]
MDTVFKLSPIALLLATNFAVADDTTETIEVLGQKTLGVDTTITADDLAKQQAQDLNDIFRKDAEVNVGGSSGISQKIYVRGLEDTMLNISIDGAEQSGNLFHHQGRLSIEPELLKQVDVSAGAGRATNGPGALGGAIQFKTKDAHDLLSSGDTFGAQVKGGYYTNNKGYKGSASLYGEVSEDLGLLASFGYQDTDNIVDGHGDEQPYTKSEQKVALLKLSGNINSHHYISLAYDYRDDDSTRLNRPHFQPSFKNEPLKQEADRQTITANHVYTEGDLIKIDTTVYTTENRIAHIDHPRWGTSEGTINTFGGKVFNTATWANNSLIVGADYKKDKNKLKGSTNTYTEKGTVYGLFLQDDWNVTDSLLLSAGARYDWYELDDNLDQNFESSDFSPNVSANYRFNNGISVFAGYAEAFRGQQVKENFVLGSNENSPARGPERAKNIEYGVKFANDMFRAGVTVFDTTIDDVVAFDYSVRKYVNAGKLETSGVTANVGLTLESFFATLSYNQSKPELNGKPLSDDNMTLGTSVGDTWLLDLNYLWNENLEFGWHVTLVEKLTDVADPKVNPEKPGYDVHDLYAQWRPLSDEELILTVSVKNVFDKYYLDHGSYHEYIGSPVAKGYANAGRDFRFNVSYAF